MSRLWNTVLDFIEVYRWFRANGDSRRTAWIAAKQAASLTWRFG